MIAEWTENYGVEKLDLGIVTVSVAYAMNGNGYQYSYGYFKSSKRYPSMDEAKAAALTSIRKRLTQAMEIIDKQ